MAKYRADRFANEVQREIAEIIRKEIKDPRLALLSIVQVEAAHDLSSVKVYFSDMGNQPAKEVTEALEKSKGFIRMQLGKRLKARVVPELHFVLDDSIAYGVRMTAMINKQIAEDNARMVNDPDAFAEEQDDL